MPESQAHIIEQLKKEILSLQGFASVVKGQQNNTGLGLINEVFPNLIFPLHAVHEFLAASAEDRTATAGFVTGMLSTIRSNHGVILWIGVRLGVFPHGFKTFGINPAHIVFISLENEKSVIWAIEESLKCPGLLAVVGELQGLSFEASRRLQLAVEKSHVTGFIINRNTKSINPTACVSRWKVRSLPSAAVETMPGIGFPGWNVELLKVRNGRTGSWQMKWVAGKFEFSSKENVSEIDEHRKTG